jgi:hypothetical protein
MGPLGGLVGLGEEVSEGHPASQRYYNNHFIIASWAYPQHERGIDIGTS